MRPGRGGPKIYGTQRLRLRDAESNVAIDSAIVGNGVEDIYIGEFPPQFAPKEGR